MIGRRRFLTGLMIALCLIAQAKAETIPFDYWYGRIIGRTQIQSIHDAYNDERGALTTSLKTGYGDAVSVNLGSLSEIGPTSQSNVFQVKFLRPKLGAVVGLGPRMRLNIDNLDWQEDSEFRSGGTSLNFTQQSRFISDQTLRILHREIEYDAERSLYHYDAGMLMQPGNWSLDVRLQTSISDYSRKSQGMIYTYLGGAFFRKVVEENDSRTWLARVVSSYGVSRKLQLTWGLEHNHGNNPAYHNSQLYEPNNLDSLVAKSTEEQETKLRNSEIFVEPVFLQSNHHWVSAKLSYRNNSRTVDTETINGIKNEVAVPVLTTYETDSHIYSISSEHTWISKHTPITLQQVLDDHGAYYNHRLPTGTIRVNSSFSLRLERRDAKDVRERVYNPVREVRSYFTRADRIMAWSEATYYSKYNLDLKMRFTLNREATGGNDIGNVVADYHTQSHGFDFQLAYYSFRWDPDQRQSIGWDKVNDIDYLFGPLMQPGDWCASISVIPPAHRWTARYSDNNIFNFFKGESNNRWILSYSSALGVCEGVEIGLGATYQQDLTTSAYDPDYSSRYRYDRWTVRPHFRWQPGTRFRMDFTAEEYYSDYDGVTWNGYYETREHEYRHTWAIRVVYSILI